MGSKPTVLFVEDTKSIAHLLAVGLDLCGITVNPVFSDAERLLDNLDHPMIAEVDMFIFDIKLPKMSGLDLAKHLRAQGETRPFALTSAWPAPSPEELKAIDAIFMPKPFNIHKLAAQIQQLV